MACKEPSRQCAMVLPVRSATLHPREGRRVIVVAALCPESSAGAGSLAPCQAAASGRNRAGHCHRSSRDTQVGRSRQRDYPILLPPTGVLPGGWWAGCGWEGRAHARAGRRWQGVEVVGWWGKCGAQRDCRGGVRMGRWAQEGGVCLGGGKACSGGGRVKLLLPSRARVFP